MVGGVAGQRKGAEEEHEGDDGGHGQAASDAEDTQGRKNQAASQITNDQNRAAVEPVHPNPGQQSEDQVGRPAGGVDQSLVPRCALEGQEDQHGQRHGGDVGAEVGYRGSEPEPHERRVGTQPYLWRGRNRGSCCLHGQRPGEKQAAWRRRLASGPAVVTSVAALNRVMSRP